MPVCRRIFVVIPSITLILLTSCGEAPEIDASGPPTAAKKLKVEYFWSSAGNTYGYASVKAGVRAAIDAVKADEQRHPGDFQLDDYVQFEEREDPDTQEAADRVARDIRRDPSVLAVIGHTKSGTSFAALPHYAEAGIPVLVTSATSPYLLYRHSSDAGVPSVNLSESEYTGERFRNTFRLIPSDVPDQAHAMELAVKRIWRARQSKHPGESAKVLLICDSTKESGAEIYSKPICDYLAAPVNRREGNYDIVARASLNERQVSSVLPQIHAMKPSIIIVAGYSPLALLIVQVWAEDRAKLKLDGEKADREKATVKPRQPEIAVEDGDDPAFIMPDGCFSPELAKAPAEVFVTYPRGPLHTMACGRNQTYLAGVCEQQIQQLNLEKRPFKCHDWSFQPSFDPEENQKLASPEPTSEKIPSIPETDEKFAYDAILILKEAVHRCVDDDELNRHCLLNYLTEHHDSLRGACEVYRVEHGDRQNAYYYLFTNAGGAWAAEGFAKEDDYEFISAANASSN